MSPWQRRVLIEEAESQCAARPGDAAARLDRVREFAREIIAYETEHDTGDDSRTRLVMAADLLAIVEGR